MKIVDEQLTGIDGKGIKLIKTNIFKDDRGFFSERYTEKKFHEIGIKNIFIQDNFSRSKPGTIRGLHYQEDPDQAKLVGCTRGKIIDVAVDIRKASKTFGKVYSVELNDENGLLLYIPAGFAHGFSVIGKEDADVMYKVDGAYNKNGEGGIAYNDKHLNIDWKIDPNIKTPLVSDKDKILPSFEEYKKAPVF